MRFTVLGMTGAIGLSRRCGILAIVLFGTVVPGVSRANDFFISITGTDSHGCTNATTDACATFDRCGAVARAAGAGNHNCYAKAGIYVASGEGFELKSGGWSNSQRITYRSAPGEVAHLITSNFSHAVVIINGRNGLPAQFLTLSDISLHGGINLDWATTNAGANGDNGCDGVTITRVKFTCSSGIGSFNSSQIMVQDSGHTGYNDALVIRDNMFVEDDTCQNGGAYGFAGFGTYPATYPGDHPDFIHLYATRGAIVENNDFIWSNTFLPSNMQQRYAFWWKGPNTQGEFRNNYIRGGIGVIAHNKSDAPGNTIHHNVVDKAGGILHGDVGPLANDKTYNNTVYLPSGSAWEYTQDTPSGSGNELFSNLLLGDSRVSGDYIKNGAGNDSWCARFTVFDYNMYWPATSGRKNWQDGGTEYTTFSAWQTHMASACGSGLKDESSSQRIDPQLEDPANHKFKPKAGSPAMSGGRGGSYSSFIGAYSGPTDSTQIGCSFDPACFGAGGRVPDATPPADVQGAQRGDVKP